MTISVNSLLVLQIETDIIICMGLLFLLIRFRKFFKPVSIEISEIATQEFRKLLDESNNAASKFLEELEKEKNELKDFAEYLDKKERMLNNLIKESKPYVDMLSSANNGSDNAEKTNSFSEETHMEVLSMARKGLNKEQISQQSGLPEGEIDLIVNLSRTKSE